MINMRGEVVGVSSEIYNPLGRLHGHFVRDPDRRGGARGRATQDHRPRQPRPHRRESTGHARSRRVDRLGKAGGALVRSVEAAPAEKAVSRRATSSPSSTARRSRKDVCRASSGGEAGQPTSLQVFRRGGTERMTVTVAEVEPTRHAAHRRRDRSRRRPGYDAGHRSPTATRRSANSSHQGGVRVEGRRWCGGARRLARGAT